jgi:NADH-quinone oxidoreductase subunit M
LTKQGIDGGIFQMISHGLISAALFLSVGVLYDRTHSRLINSYGGVVNYIPKYSLVFMIFALAALGLPGTTGFLGEFLILVGIFQKNYLVALLATTGVVLAAAYMLWLSKRVIFGETKNSEIKSLRDINFLEGITLFVLAAAIIIFGFYPDPLLETINVSVNDLLDNYQKDLIYHLKVGK